jgi:hypothetical protein
MAPLPRMVSHIKVLDPAILFSAEAAWLKLGCRTPRETTLVK